MKWTEISIHNVVTEFLRAEREQFSFHQPWTPLIDRPNLDDPSENHKRLRLLSSRRWPFLVEIPCDTKWFEVDYLSENEVGELFVSARHNNRWDRAGNRLTQVALAAPESLAQPPDQWKRVILWGHTESGPFSIFEGNHRMIAYAGATPRPPLRIKVFVGLSPSYCFWHYADPGFSVKQPPG